MIIITQTLTLTLILSHTPLTALTLYTLPPPPHPLPPHHALHPLAQRRPDTSSPGYTGLRLQRPPPGCDGTAPLTAPLIYISYIIQFNSVAICSCSFYLYTPVATILEQSFSLSAQH